MAEAMLFEDLTREIIGAYYDVFNEMPFDQPESAYANAMVIALGDRKLTVRREVTYPLHFRKVLVSESRVDLLVNDTVVVELKAGERIAPAHEKQLLSYLQVSRKPVGLLFNFGLKTEMRRLVYTRRGPKLTDE